MDFFQAGFFVTAFRSGYDGGHMSESKSTSAAPASSTARYRPETRLVHAGTIRSEFGETSEAMFLTQGYVYDPAEQCEARFKGEGPELDQRQRAVRPNTKSFFLESPTNPTRDVLDISAIAGIAHAGGARLS